MFDVSQVLGFLTAVIVLVIVPGPNTMIILAHSLNGRTAGLATVAGVELGTMFHTFAAAVGLAALLSASPVAFTAVKFAGVTYLIVVGARTLLEESPHLAEATHLGLAVAFRRALFTNLLNPKSALFFLAFLPQFVRPARGHLFLQFVLLGMIVSFVGLCVGSTQVFMAAALADFLRGHEGFGRWQQRISGSLLIAVGVFLALAAK